MWRTIQVLFFLGVFFMANPLFAQSSEEIPKEDRDRQPAHAQSFEPEEFDKMDKNESPDSMEEPEEDIEEEIE